MRIKTGAVAGLSVLVLSVGMASAQPRIYPYHSSENFCPAGMQPVTMDGVICCGKPNQSHSYQAMMAHPVKKKHRAVRHSSRADCPIGTKGCSFD